MYRRDKSGQFFNYFGEDASGRLLSSFPWKDDESEGDFEWRAGWTRYRQFYVDATMLRGEMKELIAERFVHVVV